MQQASEAARPPKLTPPAALVHRPRPCSRKQRKLLRWLKLTARPPNPKRQSQDAKPKTPKPRSTSADAEAHDEALLDMIAMEMGAPDPISDEEIAEAVAEQARLQTHLEPAQPAPVELEIAPEPVAVPAPPIRQAVQPSPPRAIEPAPAPAPASLLHLRPRWECRSARPSSRAACCESRPFRPTIRWRRSGA